MLNQDLKKYLRGLTEFETNLNQGPLSQLLCSEPVQRLKGISFIPSLCLPHDHNIVFNRYEHSLGVAFLANLVAEHLGVDSNVKVSLIAASLLHDVGHTPLSHVTEQFLVETRRRYHHSQSLLISQAIKRSTNDRTSEIIDSATHFLQKNNDSMLFPLIRGLFSCDNLDGIMRSCLTLGVSPLDPQEIISRLKSRNNRIYFLKDDTSYFQLVVDLTKQIYERELRSDYILAGEAMLVRALHLVAKDDESIVAKLLSWTDLILLDRLRSHPQSAVLLCFLEKKKPFVPLAKVSMSLAQRMFRFAKSTSRSDLDKRTAIEREIARELRIPADDVILYYTARKSIYTRALQLHLPFESSHAYDEANLDDGTDLLMFNYMHMKYVVPGGGVHIFIKPN